VSQVTQKFIVPLTSLGTQTQAIDVGSQRINNVLAGVSANDGVNLSQMNAALAALNPADSVYAATTANIPGTYVSVAAGIGDTFTTTATGTFTVDGVTPPLLSRILIKNQSSGYQNGIYSITTLGTIGVSTVFTRTLDYDTPADMNSAGLIPVINGTANALSSWQQVATIVSIGPSGTALVFSNFTANPSLYLLAANNLSDVASKLTSFNNLSPMTTAGDIIYGGTSGSGTRLGIGSTGQTLTVVSGVPAWQTPSSTSPVALLVTGTPANATANNPIKYPTVVFDTNSGYSASTGQYTAPTTGYYQVNAFLSNSAAGAAVSIYVNGSLYCNIASNDNNVGAWSGSAVVSATSGQTIDVRMGVNTGANGASSFSLHLIR
jgi:hypothetical protein